VATPVSCCERARCRADGRVRIPHDADLVQIAPADLALFRPQARGTSRRDVRARILRCRRGGSCPTCSWCSRRRPDECPLLFRLSRRPDGQGGRRPEQGEREMLVVATSAANDCHYCGDRPRALCCASTRSSRSSRIRWRPITGRRTSAPRQARDARLRDEGRAARARSKKRTSRACGRRVHRRGRVGHRLDRSVLRDEPIGSRNATGMRPQRRVLHDGRRRGGRASRSRAEGAVMRRLF